MTSNGQKSMTFWDRVQQHYNNNQPPTYAKRPSRSLETKWGVIKYNVFKFVRCHGSIVALNEFDTFEEDKLQKALEFYKTKHPKH